MINMVCTTIRLANTTMADSRVDTRVRGLCQGTLALLQLVGFA